MKKLLTFLSFTILFLTSCTNTKEEEFFKRYFDTRDIEILTMVSSDSTYSPHVNVARLYKITHRGINDNNFDSLYNEYVTLRRNFINPPYNNCIKKTYAIKVDGGEPQIHSIYYVNHLGEPCLHNKEDIMKQLIDIDHNLFYYKQLMIEKLSNETESERIIEIEELLNNNNRVNINSCQNYSIEK